MKAKGLPKKAKTKSPSWQVIYMDLMTIIMVFFVIIWSLSQAKDDGISQTIGDVATRMIDLPGDVLFPPGKTTLSGEGKGILAKLFSDGQGGSILQFEDTGLSKRMIVLHGHTDSDGTKEQNIQLGFKRAYSAYREISKFNPLLRDHVVICTHADNSRQEEIPVFTGKISADQRKTLRTLKAKNRRITIEDRTVNKFESEQ